MREAEILKRLNTETEGKKILIKQLQAKLEKKTKQEAQVIMAIREQEAEIDAIKGVKSKTSDLINKLRKRINLVIDAINNSRGEV